MKSSGSNFDPKIIVGEFPIKITNSSSKNNCNIRELRNKILLSNINTANELGPKNIVSQYLYFF